MTKQFWVYDADDKQMGEPITAEFHWQAARDAAIRSWGGEFFAEDRGHLTVSDESGSDVRRFTFQIRAACSVWEVK